MQNKHNHLLSKLSVSESEDHGAIIQLIDYEHTDYIEDVLVEYFDIEYEYKIINDEENKYILCFAKTHTKKQVEEALKLINNFHSEKCMTYETI